MALNTRNLDPQFKTIDDPDLLSALNELSRSINIITTYGKEHPAVQMSIVTTRMAMQTLFRKRKRLIIGSFNGAMTVDEVPIHAKGTLIESLERRLTRLHITGLKLSMGIGESELIQLAKLLSSKEADEFQTGINQAGLTHISSKNTSYKAVHDGQTVANNSDLAGTDGNGVLVLEEDSTVEGEGPGNGDANKSVHVDQIVAFLKGDINSDQPGVGEELSELASDPARLGQMIMESVAIRQSACELSGESLGDIVLGCLRRTYSGLRKQPAFQTSEGKADLQKSLLLLEESMLDKMRNLSGDENTELDRQIVQTIREMDESLGFEMSAMQYMEHHDGIKNNEQELQEFIKAKGEATATDLLSKTDFPKTEWRKIIGESKKSVEDKPPIMAGLNTLTTVFEKLENLIKSNATNENQVKNLVGQVSDNLEDTIFTTTGKLELLSQQIKDDKTGTIGGQGRNMNQDELLAALSEVAQELMQPLTAINTSLEMMLNGYVGEVTNDQLDLLELASNSGEHLKFLMNMLIEIVGCPANKGIDSRFHTTSDEVALLKETEKE